MGYKVYARHGGAVAASLDDITARVPGFDEAQPIIELGMSFQNGGASQGTMIVPDPVGNMDDSLYFPPRTLIRWTEDASGDELWLAQGRVSAYSIGRPDYRPPAASVEWNLTVDDANVDLRGLAFTEGWVRPAETGTERLYALALYTLNGTSSTRPDFGGSITYRPSTTIIALDSHLAPDTNTVVMPAKTYPIDTQPSEVLTDIASTEGKVFGVVLHHTGGTSHLCLEYILETDHSTYASPCKISDNPVDWDPEDLTAPVFVPIYDQGDAQRVDGNAFISGIVSRYGAGADQIEVLLDTTVADATEYWVESYQDGDSTEALQAQARATGIIAYRSPYAETDSVSIDVLPEQAHLITAGMSLQIKAAPINTSNDSSIGSYLDRRIVALQWQPRPDGLYHGILQLNRPQRAPGAGVGRFQPASQMPSLCHGTESECLDDFLRVSDGDWGLSPIKCLTWQTHAGFLPANEATDSSIVGSVGIQNSDGAFVHNDYFPLDGWDGTPPEFLIKTRFDEVAWFQVEQSGSSVGPGGIGVQSYGDGAIFKWKLGIDGSGNVDAEIQAVDANGTYVSAFSNLGPPLLTGATGVWLWARCEIDDHSIYLTLWKDGDADPGSPNLQVTWDGNPVEPHFLDATLGIQNADLFQVISSDNLGNGVAGTIEVDSIEIISGNDCGTVGICDVCGLTGGPARTPGTSNDGAPIDHDHDSVDNGSAAAGDLAGTYPAPTIPHITDTTAAHVASSIGFTPNGSIAATDVQAAIQEVRDEATGGGSGPFEDAGGGPTIWNLITGATNLQSTDGSTDIELDTDQLILSNFTDGSEVRLESGLISLSGPFGVIVPIASTDPAGGDSSDGQVYYNNTSLRFRAYQNGVWVDLVRGALTSRTSAVAIANTETVVSSFSMPSGGGSSIFMHAGTTFRIRAFGRLTSGGTPGSSIFRCRIGTTTLTGNIPATLTLTNGTSVTNAPFSVEMLVTIRTDGGSGTAIGNVIVDGGVIGAFTVAASVSAISATVVVDTTATKLIEFTYISGNSGTTATFENAVIELLQ